MLGAVHTFLHNLGTARILLERAVAIDPNAAWAWSRLAWTDVYSDRPAEAIEKFERALRLSPLDPMNFNNWIGIGSAHEVDGDLEQAIAFYRRGLAERPHAEWLYRHLAAGLAGRGPHGRSPRRLRPDAARLPGHDGHEVQGGDGVLTGRPRAHGREPENAGPAGLRQIPTLAPGENKWRANSRTSSRR